LQEAGLHVKKPVARELAPVRQRSWSRLLSPP
jgi:hypothetical protein